MRVEEVVRARLLASAGVSSLVGTRIYQLLLQQGVTYPAIRVQLISEPRDYHLRGADGSVRSRVQIDAYAQATSGVDPYDVAGDIADAVREALTGVAPFEDGGSPAELLVTGAFVDSRRVLYEPDELRVVRVSQDVIVWSRAA